MPSILALMEKVFPRLLRKLPTAILLLAAVLMLARPICELWHAGAVAHRGGAQAASMPTGASFNSALKTPASDALCCTASADGGMSQIAQAAAFGNTSDDAPPIPPVLFAMAFLAFALLARPAVAFRPPPRIPQSYCQRSSRILR